MSRLSVLILALVAGICDAAGYCDSSVPQNADSPHGYREREGRCEGLFIKEVAGSTTLLVASLTESFVDFDPAKTGVLHVDWTAPANAGATKLRAFGLRRKQYYRMDSVCPATEAPFRWPADVLANLNLTQPYLGVVAWSTVRTGGAEREVYLPLRISPAAAPPSNGNIELRLVSGAELEEVFMALSQLDPQSGARKLIYDKKPLKQGFYPAERPITIALTGLTQPGYYHLSIGATLRSGGAATTGIYLYRAPAKRRGA